MAPPTKHDEKIEPPSTDAASGAAKVVLISCRANKAWGRGGPRRPSRRLEVAPAPAVGPAPGKKLRGGFWMRVREDGTHRCPHEAIMARRRASSLLRRVGGSAEDGLAALMAQLTTTTTTTTPVAGGDRAATGVTASAMLPAAGDQSSPGIGEMFDKMAVSSNE